MCAPAMAWDWFVLDVAYVLVVVGGGMVLRARLSMPTTWVLFGSLSIAVGAFLLAGTYQLGLTASAASADAEGLLAACAGG